MPELRSVVASSENVYLERGPWAFPQLADPLAQGPHLQDGSNTASRHRNAALRRSGTEASRPRFPRHWPLREPPPAP